MILVGRFRSPYTRRVAITLRLLGISYEHRSIKPWPSNDELLPMNPLGRVPILILDDGDRLQESTMILDYLDGLVGPGRALTPPDGPERLRVQKIVFLALGVLDKVVLANHERYRRPEGMMDVAWIERCESQALSGMTALDAITPDPWLAGDGPSQADVTTGVLCDHVRLTCPHLAPAGRFPNLDALSARCGGLPAFAETVPEF
jgi:glutathione S-transferase